MKNFSQTEEMKFGKGKKNCQKDSNRVRQTE